MKTCSKCKINKPLMDFWADRRSSDGRASACRECYSLAQKARRKIITSSKKPSVGSKTCGKCENTKDVTFFSKNPSRLDGYNTYCNDCRSKYDKDRRQDEKANPIKTAVAEKRCYSCKQTKPIVFFNKDKGSKTGYGNHCKSCKYGEHIQRKYSLSLDIYISMLQRQNNKCAICGLEFINQRPCVDHNHVTQELRGLLCRDCNSAIGLLKDDIEILNGAIKYLQSYP